MAVIRSYSALVGALSPLGHWRLNERSGTTAIDQTGDLNGIYQNGVVLGRGGMIGDGGARFDGIDDRIVVATLSGTVTVAAFGDSLVGGERFQSANEQFSPELERALEARGLNATVLDFGNGGDTSTQGLARIGSVIAAAPDVTIVEFGTNDAGSRTDPSITKSSLDQIVMQLNDAGSEVLLTGTFGNFPRPLGYRTEAQRDAFERIFPDLAADPDLDVTLLRDAEGSDKFLGGERVANGTEIIGGVLDDPALNVGDGLHPNAAGIDQIVERIMPQTVALGAAAGAVDEPLLLANGSFELKFRPATLDAGDAPGRALFSKNGEGQGTGGHVSVLLRENGGVLATIGDAENDFSLQSAAGVVRVGEPAHLVVTFGQSGLHMFVDGAQVARDPGITIGLDAGQGNYEPLVLGMDAGLPGFAGVIDEFAVYDRALTARQIDRLFQAGEQGGRLVGTAGDDEIIGGPENQTLLGGAGADTLRAGAGNDVLRGGPGPDVLQGGQGNDQLFGGGGADRMSGGAGNDFLVGGPGKDVLAGGPGSDVFRLDRPSERADRILDFEP